MPNSAHVLMHRPWAPFLLSTLVGAGQQGVGGLIHTKQIATSSVSVFFDAEATALNGFVSCISTLAKGSKPSYKSTSLLSCMSGYIAETQVGVSRLGLFCHMKLFQAITKCANNTPWPTLVSQEDNVSRSPLLLSQICCRLSLIKQSSNMLFLLLISHLKSIPCRLRMQVSWLVLTKSARPFGKPNLQQIRPFSRQRPRVEPTVSALCGLLQLDHWASPGRFNIDGVSGLLREV